MNKVILMKGLVASGKSSYSKKYIKDHPNTFRVNKDDLRAMLSNGVFNKKLEKVTVASSRCIAGIALQNGMDVIIDDTNFNPIHEKAFRQMAENFNTEFEVVELKVPIEECIRRDATRENPVGEEVIRNMAKKWGVE